MTELTSAQVAEITRGRLTGPPDLIVTGVASLDEAQASDVSFLGNDKYRVQVLPSAAAVVIVPPDYEPSPPPGRAWVVCDQPSLAFALVADRVLPAPPVFVPGIHPSAVIDSSAVIPDSVHVGALTVIAAGVTVAENTVIGACCYVGADTCIGRDCHFHPHVTIRERTVIGDRVGIHCGTVIGSDGFGYEPGVDGHTKIPQRGIVQIDDDVEIGALVAVDRARFGRTWIRRGAKIDNLVQLAHNVVIGEHTAIASQSGVSGSTRIGSYCRIAGQVGLSGHIEIADRTTILGQTGVSKSITEPGKTWFGYPAKEQMRAGRIEAVVRSLPEIKAEVDRLKDDVDKLQKNT